jgi:hypothetical protein
MTAEPARAALPLLISPLTMELAEKITKAAVITKATAHARNPCAVSRK